MPPSLVRRLLPALAMLALPAAAAAQPLLRPGPPVRGEITAQDPALDDDTHYDLYTFRAAAGERFRVTMRSRAFDAYLVVGRIAKDACAAECRSDDDGGGGTDARVTLRFEEAGTYVVRANTLGTGQTGAYTIQLESLGVGPLADDDGDDAGPDAPVIPTGTLTVGQTVRGALTERDPLASDDSRVDTYLFTGRPGQRIAITMEAEDFDTYLAWGLLRPDGRWTPIAANDDGDAGTDARLVVEVGSAGTYVVRANSLSAGVTGDYTLSVRPARSGEALSATVDDEVAAGADERAGTAVRGTVRPGQTVEGALDADDPLAGDGSHFEEWAFEARAGQTVTFTLRSEDFDAFVAVGSVERGVWAELDSNDDAVGDGTDARVTVTFPSAGRWLVRANSLGGGETGRYRLEVRGGR